MTGASDRTIDIAVCTYRRPQLAETLHSIGRLAVPEGARLHVIVADNDAEPSARPVVDAVRDGFPFAIDYVHCPASNISIARNACLDHATGEWLAFIDDDCVASTQWLGALLAVADDCHADAVLGPVRAIYGHEAPNWMKRGDFHSTHPVFVQGELLTGYTCNVLMRRTASPLAARRFDVALGRTGGEDTQFFTEMRRAGGRIAYAETALASEAVPEARARFSWLAKRKFRTGQTHGRLLCRDGRPTLGQIALAASKTAYCGGAAVLSAFAPIRRNRYALRGIMHAGVVSGLVGIREITLYGEGQGHAA